MRDRHHPCAAAAALLVLLATANAGAAVNYSLDDGSAELGVGLSPAGGSVFFANRFTAAPGGERLTSLSVAYGLPGNTTAARPGTPVHLFVFRDAAGRTTPHQPVLLASTLTEVMNPGTDTFNRIPIRP